VRPVDAVNRAQTAGAIGVVFYDTTQTTRLFLVAPFNALAVEPTIPAYSINATDGALITTALAASTPVTVRFMPNMDNAANIQYENRQNIHFVRVKHVPCVQPCCAQRKTPLVPLPAFVPLSSTGATTLTQSSTSLVHSARYGLVE
jgi:hypothetical protein